MPGIRCLWTQWSPGPFSLRCSTVLAVEKSQSSRRGDLMGRLQSLAEMPSGCSVLVEGQCLGREDKGQAGISVWEPVSGSVLDCAPSCT